MYLATIIDDLSGRYCTQTLFCNAQKTKINTLSQVKVHCIKYSSDIYRSSGEN